MIKYLLLALIMMIPVSVFGYSYPSVPNTFVANTTIQSAKVNANFGAITTALSAGTKKVNFIELYLNGTRVIDSSRNLTSVNLNVSGNTIMTGTLRTIGAITGTLATADQPNITHTGTLSTLNVTGATKLSSTVDISGALTASTRKLYVSSTKVGIDTLSPQRQLSVSGDVQVTGSIYTTAQLKSTLANGTAPFSVQSATVVPSLNAQMFEGHRWSEVVSTSTTTISVSGNVSAGGVVSRSKAWGSTYAIGATGTLYMESSAIHHGILYFGTTGTSVGSGNSRIYSFDGNAWSLNRTSTLGYTVEVAVYKDTLYSVEYTGAAMYIYKLTPPSTWTLISSIASNGDIKKALEFSGNLYIGTADGIVKFDGTTLSNVAGTGVPTYVSDLALYGGKLFTCSDLGKRIDSYDGATWVNAYTNTAGAAIHSMCVYKGLLYFGRTTDIYTFNGITASVSTSSALSRVDTMTVYNGKLYAGGLDSATNDIYVFDGNKWSIDYTASEDYMRTSIAYNGTLYFAGGPNRKVYSFAEVSPTLTDGNTELYDGSIEAGYHNFTGLSIFKGKVGFGTDYPEAAVSVSGNMKVTGNMTVTGIISGALKDNGPSLNMNLKLKVVNIPTFNMTDLQKIITVWPGVNNLSKICGTSVLITNDAGTLTYPIDHTLSGGTVSQGQYHWLYSTDTKIDITAQSSGMFDSADYDNASIVRGRILIWYYD